MSAISPALSCLLLLEKESLLRRRKPADIFDVLQTHRFTVAIALLIGPGSLDFEERQERTGRVIDFNGYQSLKSYLKGGNRHCLAFRWPASDSEDLLMAQ